MARSKAPKNGLKRTREHNETQNIDPVFGQGRAFALEGDLVNPEVQQYLKTVRTQALTTLAARPSNRGRHDTKVNRTSDLYDEEPLIPPELSRFNRYKSSWLKWFNELKRSKDAHTAPAPGYDSAMLNLLVFYFKQYLQELKAAASESDADLDRILTILQDHNVEKQDSTLEIDEEWAKGILQQLKSSKSQVSSVSDLKDFISKPAPLPKNFNGWYYCVTKTEPTCALFERMSPELTFKLASYLNQWLGDVSKDKKASRITAWILYTFLFLGDQLPAQEVSVLRDLGKKARQMKLNCSDSADALPKIVQPSDMSFYKDPPQPLSAIDLILVLVAFKYGQRDLVDWIEFAV